MCEPYLRCLNPWFLLLLLIEPYQTFELTCTYKDFVAVDDNVLPFNEL
jgi:hypothetical protein